MSDYRALAGHNLALASLTLFSPQPSCEGLQYTREAPVFGGVYLEGPFFYLVWDLLPNASAYGTILSTVNLQFNAAYPATVYGPNDLYGMARYNATAIRPLVGQTITRSNFRLRNIGLLFKDLELLA